MNIYFKYGLIFSAGLVTLFIALLAVVAFTVNPNDYKPLIVKLVQEKKERTLTLDGDIKLALFPKIGLDLGKVSLSEHKGTTEFASVEGVKLYVAWLPLLRKSLVVDHVSVDGIRANLARYANGTTNIDDLIKKEEESEQVKFDIEGVKITRSGINVDDQMGKHKFSLNNFSMQSGRLKDGAPTDIALDFNAQLDHPFTKIQVQLKSGLLFELEKKHYALESLNLGIKGDAAGISEMDFTLKGDLDAKLEDSAFLSKNLKLSVTGKQGIQKLNVKLDAPKFQLSKDKVSSDKLSLEAQIDQPQGSTKARLTIPAMQGTGAAFQIADIVLDVDGKQGDKSIKGKLTSPFKGNLEMQRFDLSKVIATFNISNPALPKGNMNLTLSGNAYADIKKQDIALNATTRLDDSHIQAKLGMTNFAAQALRFDVAIDQLDIDRYLPPSSKKQSAEAEKPFDMSALKNLNANGSIRVGTLKLSNVKSTNVRLDMQAASGKFNINPMSANLYQGSMNGTVSIHTAATPQFYVKQNLRGISIGPLLKDLADKDILEGKGSISLDISTTGTTVSALKRSLNGNAALDLTDGAIKGINIAGTLRNAKSKLGMLKGEQSQAANPSEKTDFSELKASFIIRNGVAHNEDLAMKSPLLRLSGNGDINVGESSMNYLSKATVVGSLEGQGGAELAALKGLTIPVRIAGPYTSLKYTLDYNELATGAVKAKVQDELKDKLKSLFGR